MTMPSIDLDAVESSSEPLASFVLGGREWHIRQKDDLAWGISDTLFGQTDPDDPRAAVVQIGVLFESAIVPEEVDAFKEMLRAPNSGLTMRRVAPLVQFIAEQLFERPTKKPSDSSDGAGTTATSSEGDSSLPDTQNEESAA